MPRSAEMPTRCASVNYCGTQAPIWLHLERDQRLPELFQETQLTGCSTWSRIIEDDGDVPQDDCCAMKYPITVRNCSSFLIYQLQPTEACNMAYCAQLPSMSGIYNLMMQYIFSRSSSSRPYTERVGDAISSNRQTSFFFMTESFTYLIKISLIRKRTKCSHAKGYFSGSTS